MKSFKNRSVALLLTLCLLLALSVTAFAAPEANPIVILYTNDVHTTVSGVETDEETGAYLSGESYAALAAYKAELETQYGADYVTLVDAGDFSQGAVLGTLSKGGYLIDIMNAVGYDVVTVGNHEFDYGMARMQENMAALNAAVTSCNFIDLKTGEPCYDAYTMLTYGETQVAFVGVTTPESYTKSSPTYFQDGAGNYIYGLCEDATGQVLYSKVQQTIDAAVAAGADYVIGLGHLGVDAESEPWTSTLVITNTTGFDAFIDGHSHTSMAGELVKDAGGADVLLTQTGTKLAAFGQLTIAADGTLSSQLINTYEGADEAVSAKVQEIQDENAELLSQVVAASDVDLTIYDPTAVNEDGSPVRIVRSQETNLGDLCADAYRILLGADIGAVNGGGIRTSIAAGDITYEQIVNVHPFGNAACLGEITGQQIADMLEHSYSHVGESQSGGFLQLSGITCTIDPNIPSPVELDDKDEFVAINGTRRVSDIRILSSETGAYEPIDLAKTYTIALHDYYLKFANDGFTMLGTDDITILQDSVMLDNQVLINYITNELGGVVGEAYANPYGQGRITILPLAEDEAEPVYGTAADTEALNPTPIVVPTTQSLTINGVPVSPAAYNCDGSNYFKIRDLAALLNAAGVPVNVGYDAEANAVQVTLGESYVPDGSELTPVGPAAETVVSPQKLFVNGVEVAAAAYNIDGYNYFKLRDLGAALGFGVDYDEATATMLVTVDLPEGAVSTLSAAQTEPAGDYAAYLKAFVDSCADISADQAVEFYAAIDAGDYTAFPVVMLFEQTPDGGYWFGEPALTEAEFAAGAVAVADHPTTGSQLEDAPAAEDGAAPDAAPAA